MEGVISYLIKAKNKMYFYKKNYMEVFMKPHKQNVLYKI